MKIAVRIQHHASRADLIPRLLAALKGFDDVQVVTDEGTRPDAWRAHRSCLLAMPSDASHLLVLQDDALPCQQFASKMLAACERHPESILLAFVPGFPRERKGMHDARKVGATFAPFIIGSYLPTVAICYPRAVAEGLLAWAERRGNGRNRRPLRGADDGIAATYARTHRLRPLMLVPCIVDHDDTVASVGKRMRKGSHRRAALL